MPYSSQFEHFRLLTTSIGLLMVVAPHFGSALECYVSDGEIAAALPLRAPAQWKLNKLMNFTTSLGIKMPHALNDGQGTEQCAVPDVGYSNHCFTLHCAKIYGDKTTKGCVVISDKFTPVQACKYFSERCADDSKFYCRICNTDKCNNE